MIQFITRNSSFVILLLVLLSWGCQKKSTVVTPPFPEITPAPPSKPAPSPKPNTASSRFEVGETHFKAGNYRQAIQSFEAFLLGNPKSTRRDQALFYLGLSRLLASDSSRDQSQADAAFSRLIKEFPQSQYRNQAELILGLHAQIERLRADVKERDDRIRQIRDELRRLKEIDLQRRPTRPPE